MKFINVLKMLFGITAQLNEAFDAAEALMPGRDADGKPQGATRLAHVRECIRIAVELSGGAMDLFNEIWPKIEGFIAAVAARRKVAINK